MGKKTSPKYLGKIFPKNVQLSPKCLCYFNNITRLDLASIDMLSPQKYQGEWEADGVESQLVGEGEILHQPADKKILILTR